MSYPMLKPEPTNETLNKDDPYGWADRLRETTNDDDDGEPLCVHMVPRHSLVGLTLRKGRRECRNRKKAMGIVHKALKMGMPIDCTEKLDGTWVVFVSSKGVDAIRAKHGISERRLKKPKRKPTRRKTIETVSDASGLNKKRVTDMVKALGTDAPSEANELVLALYNRKTGRNVSND